MRKSGTYSRLLQKYRQPFRSTAIRRNKSEFPTIFTTTHELPETNFLEAEMVNPIAVQLPSCRSHVETQGCIFKQCVKILNTNVIQFHFRFPITTHQFSAELGNAVPHIAISCTIPHASAKQKSKP